MIYTKNNNFNESTVPHSLALQNAMTIPSPGFDSNELMIEQKKFWGGGLQGLGDISLLFSDPTTWLTTSDTTAIISGIPNFLTLGVGLVAIWWLVTPGGKDYKEAKARLRTQHRGYKRLGKYLEVTEDGGSRSKFRKRPMRGDY